MRATLYTPTGAAEYDPTTGARYDLPFLPEPMEENPTVESSDYASRSESIRAIVDRYSGPGRGEFVWWTHDNEAMSPEDMATPHIFYALRMVWNHSVPLTLKVGDGPNYPDVRRWCVEYRKAAIETLSNELAQRDDELSVEQRAELFEILQKTVFILNLGW